MATLLDANAILRYLLEDNEEQAEKTATTIQEGAEVTVEVLAECVYVLQGVYGVSRAMVAESLGLLLDETDCRRKAVALEALGLYSGSGLDFVDCVLAAEHDACGHKVLTFDKKLKALMRRLDEASL